MFLLTDLDFFSNSRPAEMKIWSCDLFQDRKAPLNNNYLGKLCFCLTVFYIVSTELFLRMQPDQTPVPSPVSKRNIFQL